MLDDELIEPQNSSDKKEAENYYVLSEPASSMDVTYPSFENSQTVKNHIIVCGIHSSIKNFIMPLRAKYLKEN